MRKFAFTLKHELKNFFLGDTFSLFFASNIYVKAKSADTEKQFLEVIGANQGTLFKICLMFTDRSREDIRDLYHDILCALWEGWGTFEDRSTLNTWIYRVALNTAIDKHRRTKRQPVLISLDEGTLDSLAQAAESELVDEFYLMVDQLEPDEKALLRLYLDKVRLRDIAAILGTAEITVKRRLQRIKDRLIILHDE